MSRSVLAIPLILGRRDSLDPKFAPLGVLAVAKNLRVRADGRLACRNGYAAVSMGTVAGTLTAYDLIEYQGRLLALGSDAGDASPADVFELVSSTFSWRASDANRNQTLCPFTNPRETCGISQLGDGVARVTGAVGGGFSGLAWCLTAVAEVYAMITRQADGQVLHREKLSSAAVSAQMTFAVDTFYLQIGFSNGDVKVLKFTPGTDASFVALVTHVAGGAIGAHDLVPVTSPSTARVVSAVWQPGSGNVTIKCYSSAGAQIGATCTFAVALTGALCVEANQTDNTINAYTTAGTTGQIRTFNLTTGALTLGPTATALGNSGSMCRLPTLGANVQAIAVAVNTTGTDVAVQLFSQSAHALVTSFSVQRAQLRSRLLNAQSGTQKRAVVFGGLVAPALPANTDPTTLSTTATAALFYVSSTCAHMSTRDVSNAIDPAEPTATTLELPNLQLDTSTNRLCWITMRNTSLALGGRNLAQPAFTLIDFLSPERRSSAQYGALAYLTGATVQAYDGLFPAELNFNELPGIYSATPGGGGGLFSSGKYSYVHHWEYTRADGSVEQSAPSVPLRADTGALDTQNTLLVSTPHSIRVALGATLFGGTVVSVLSRTVFNLATNTQLSQYRRCQVKQIPAGMASYGAPLSIIDNLADSTLATQAIVYTQGARGELSGPLQHDAPEGCSYVSASSARLLIGGLARGFEFEESKEAKLDEPINFAEFSSFFGKISKAVIGVLSLDGVRLIFARDAVYSVTGEGANDIGGNALPAPVELASASGLRDWRSLLKAQDGVYFQLDLDKLYQIPRGAGSPHWAGVDIKDTLRSFPTITGACLSRTDDVAAFACQNVAANDARVIVRSLRTGIWTEDTVPLTASSGIAAIAAIGDTLAYISGGVVFQQSSSGFTDQGGAAITTQAKTHPIYPFGLGGYGQLCDVMVVGEFRSAGTLALRVSIDDGASFVTYDSFTITGLAVGATFRRCWALQQSDASSGIFEWTFTPSAPGEGVILHEAFLLSNSEPGKLLELDPAECA